MVEFIIPLYYNLDTFRFTDGLAGSARDPITLGQSNVISWAVRFVRSGVAVELTNTPTVICGLKLVGSPSSDFLVQTLSTTKTGTGATTVYTFTTTIASAELDTQLNLASAVNCAFVIYDSANGIATLPSLMVTILPNPNLSGSYSTTGLGTLAIAALKTLTVTNSLTLTGTDGASANLDRLANLATGKVLGRTTAGTGAVEELSISGTGSVAMTISPSFTTPSLGAATATSLVISTSATYGLEVGNSGNFVAGFFHDNASNGVYLCTGSSGGDQAIYATGDCLFGGGTFTVNGASAFNNTLAGTSSLTLGVFSTTSGSVVLRTAGHASFTTTINAATPTASYTVSILPTGSVTMTLPPTSFTAARTDAAQTFDGTQAFSGIINLAATTSSTLGVIQQNGTRLAHTYGTLNLFIGPSSGNFTTTGTGANCGVGSLTLSALTSGTKNMAFGSAALQNVQGGNSNVGVGEAAGNSLTSGSANVLIGGNTGQGIISGSNNTAIGYQAMIAGTGSTNVCIGTYAGYDLTSGSTNVLIGHSAGRNDLGGGAAITTGTNNTMIGESAQASAAAASYQTALGAGATCTANNQIMLGRSSEHTVVPGGMVYGSFTVGTFPATTYLEAVVTDALAPVVGAAVASGGSAKCKVMYNGSAKIVTAVL